MRAGSLFFSLYDVRDHVGAALRIRTDSCTLEMWRCDQSEVDKSPLPQFPVMREFTGNFDNIPGFSADQTNKIGSFAPLASMDSLLTRTGSFLKPSRDSRQACSV